jgi:glutaredoxin
MMKKELVMYSRTFGCSYISTAKKTLSEYNVSFREIFIDKDEKARQYVLNWTGFLSVPTLIVANQGDDLPYQKPSDLSKGQSPRGVNRGTMITEASHDDLVIWLAQHGFIEG